MKTVTNVMESNLNLLFHGQDTACQGWPGLKCLTTQRFAWIFQANNKPLTKLLQRGEDPNFDQVREPGCLSRGSRPFENSVVRIVENVRFCVYFAVSKGE